MSSTAGERIRGLPSWGAVVIAVAVLFGGVATSAEAKMPPFEVEVDVERTTATITVEVQDASFDASDLNGLVAVYPDTALDGRLRPETGSDGLEVDLDRIRPGVYQGTVGLERAGRWAVVPFPTSPAYEPVAFYPESVLFETTTNPTWPLDAGVVFGSAVLLVVAGLSWRVRWLRRSRSEALSKVRIGPSAPAANPASALHIGSRRKTS
ncbi:MAG: hypothetical protein H0T94_04075 [Acidimicrobiia bacterium]|nr:hypothetical protein [Acidimicrobiia bacterium]